VERFLDFFYSQIENDNTRAAYARAVARFLHWCQRRGMLSLDAVTPLAVAAYLKDMAGTHSRPTRKQHLAAVRRLYDHLVTGHIVSTNPASSVHAPKYRVTKGKTPVLSAQEARQLLDAIPTDTIAGLRDRALISTMIYTFARVSAVSGMRVRDYYTEGRRASVRLAEKGGVDHSVRAHHCAEEALDAYIRAAALSDPESPLFRTVDRYGCLTARAVTRNDCLRMVKRRARAAGLSASTCNHTFRATGITAYMRNGGDIKIAASLAAHVSTRTTQLYDRSEEDVSLDEIERIVI
jgi:site-specific recombinase XerD